MIGNLVHSSPNIKKEVLAAGALQPVIGLLRCSLVFIDMNFSLLAFLFFLASTSLLLLSFTAVTTPTAIQLKQMVFVSVG